MKYLCLIVVFLAACTPTAKEVLPPVLPEGLKDCKFYELFDGGSYMKVVRCPSSSTSTTYRQGKTNKNTVLIDGVEYVSK